MSQFPDRDEMIQRDYFLMELIIERIEKAFEMSYHVYFKIHFLRYAYFLTPERLLYTKWIFY